MEQESLSVLEICLKLQAHGIVHEYLTEELSYSEARYLIADLGLNPDDYLPELR